MLTIQDLMDLYKCTEKALAVKLGNTTVYTKLARVCFSKICCVIENLITFLKRYVYCTCNEMLSTNFKRTCY